VLWKSRKQRKKSPRLFNGRALEEVSQVDERKNRSEDSRHRKEKSFTTADFPTAD